MSSVAAGWALTGLALGLLMTGNPVPAFFVASSAIACVATAPTADQRDARRRNQARRVR